MRKKPILFGIHASPPSWLKWVYILTPFAVYILGYEYFSAAYLADTPGGKLLPSYTTMGKRLWDLAFTQDFRTHAYLLWSDTWISLTMRFLTGLVLAAFFGLMLGLNMAIFPALRYLLLPTIVVLSFVPIVAVLPILLIVLGIGEESKVTLIFLGLVFYIARDIFATVCELPKELLIKAQTLGASPLGYVYRVVLPMIMPRLFEVVRQSLGIAWACLLIGEGIAASEGLAYRIFLARRTSDMATIIPYVVWITILAICVYFMLVFVQKRLYPWKEI